MNYDQAITEAMKGVCKTWDENILLDREWTNDEINKFLDLCEGTLINFGIGFVKGLRIIDNSNNRHPHPPMHQTREGVLGIVSLNIHVIKKKLQRTNN